MANLPGTNITQVVVTGTFVDFAGDPILGTVTFTPTPSAMTDAGSNVTFMPRPVTVPITSGGAMTATLAATDDPEGNPVGFTYTVTENFAGGRTYAISLPAASSPVDLADISPASSADAGTVVWAGMPAGGTTGQFMVKTGSANYDAGWTTMADQYLQGTGFPEGVVTAPVGSIYTDTAATNGAIRWIKASGAGNTGWKVEYGDTGIRGLQAVSLSNGWALYVNRFTLHRIGNTVTLSLYLNATSATSDIVSTSLIPVGFRPAGLYLVNAHRGTPADRSNIVEVEQSTGKVTVYNRIASGEAVYIDATWVTPEAWPSTLPGV